MMGYDSSPPCASRRGRGYVIGLAISGSEMAGRNGIEPESGGCPRLLDAVNICREPPRCCAPPIFHSTVLVRG